MLAGIARGVPSSIIPNIHILHTHDNIIVVAEESSIEVYDVLRIAIVHDLQLPNNPTAHLLFGFDVNNLASYMSVIRG